MVLHGRQISVFWPLEEMTTCSRFGRQHRGNAIRKALHYTLSRKHCKCFWRLQKSSWSSSIDYGVVPKWRHILERRWMCNVFVSLAYVSTFGYSTVKYDVVRRELRNIKCSVTSLLDGGCVESEQFLLFSQTTPSSRQSSVLVSVAAWSVSNRRRNSWQDHQNLEHQQRKLDQFCRCQISGGILKISCY